MKKLIPALAMDLDGTVLHKEEEAIPVLGKSGLRYMSMEVFSILTEISKSFPILIATGRNATSVGKLTSGLDPCPFCGYVLENGLVARKTLCGKVEKKDEWALVAGLLNGWERLSEYENCLGLMIPKSVKDPLAEVKSALLAAGKKGTLLREPEKIFVYTKTPSKLIGIRKLGFEPAIALGDELNDLTMLRAGAFPGTISTAHEDVKTLVKEKNGFCSHERSHKASVEMLQWAREIIREKSQSRLFIQPEKMENVNA